MRTPAAPILLALAVAVFPIPARALVKDYFVPSIKYPTVQSAIADASLNINAADLSEIFITQSPIHEPSGIVITGPFNPTTRRLLIRPDATLGRATIIGDAVAQPIVQLTGGGQNGGATFEDLDLVRDVTNNSDLIKIDYGFTNVVFDRCRIGSTSFGGGNPGFNMVVMSSPVQVMFRNCILFAVHPGTFEIGFEVTDFFQDVGSLFLYNNDVADYSVCGIHIVNHPLTHTATLVLRNNVVANSPDFPATSEPFAFRSEVDEPGTTVLSSGNATFASALRIQSLVGASQSLIGTDLDHLPRSVLGDPTNTLTAFQQRTWDPLQGFDANPLFFHLWPSGALHDGPEDVGTTVLLASPDFRDIAVTSDIDHDPRPSGAFPGHTDRGADQAERDNTGVGGNRPHVALAVAPARNPASRLELNFRAGATGRLRCEVFDASGRRVASREQPVSAGEEGRVSFTGPQGVLQYRMELVPEHGPHATVVGRAVILR